MPWPPLPRARTSSALSHVSLGGYFLDPLLPRAVRLDRAQVAAIGEQGGVVFVVGVEQGRMRAMAMREGAARSEFQAVLAVVTCPQSRSAPLLSLGRMADWSAMGRLGALCEQNYYNIYGGNQYPFYGGAGTGMVTGTSPFYPYFQFGQSGSTTPNYASGQGYNMQFPQMCPFSTVASTAAAVTGFAQQYGGPLSLAASTQAQAEKLHH